ncbi:MAG: cbb3-type cytochrome c oxidase subunit II [SAR202 cluster bacterium]|jgi:cbb3-type cytochrome c oxidase subunit II|nr:cbb3-type cytochrome c oxidase subunit II [SAR202 cluster bacterium]MDP7104933.1 cbb3-type cytochrome c oxidase subunit II [SAR202 cluster bacterium]MDP7413025.1 cbb3-type cytochrome c oxidase subunit II [SAR202 cluster bacterium]MDP7533672.1 cbb3-type cytochrome c oxidase subunit II [SAR202 cluster bacterium]HJO83596.1 cbb3-type cytochrome c oxidase subunit II [SAR202 cluster bacterium]|tara:strand:+ start:6030 stop:6515 length:486 start_codon:yes stop_codon:yes gene_type:complete
MKQPSILYLIVGSFAFLIAGFVVTVWLPGFLKDPQPTEFAVRYNDVQLEGRDIYIREGCWYCHTQQVRSIEVEVGTVRLRGDIGPESVPGDYVYQKPVLWGTNRQGPDLSHVASRPYATKEWHIIHLEDPNNVVPGSVMPSFEHLNDRDMDALSEYLMALK